MNKIEIPYHQTGYFSKLICDYIDGKDEISTFYNYSFEINSFEKIIKERKNKPINRDVLVEALTEQYENVETLMPTKINIQNLKNENCFTVTTGHQLNLFTGPLFFIYKIVSTINLASELKRKYPENDFVPVYWMATEDHDFEEVSYFNLFKKTYKLNKTQSGAVGKMKLEGVETLLSELKDNLGEREGVEKVISIFSKFYSSEKTYSDATRGIINYLFGKYGLIIIDGDDKSLKGLFSDEFRNELLIRKNHQLINSTSEILKELGYKSQLAPREINIFYLKERLRERIFFEENKYKVLNSEIEFSEDEILEELKSYPERFSPNAPMRCLYQEKILPNLAYIGGGGELSYWLQLKEMFEANNVIYPLLVLRNSVLFIDSGSNKRISKLSFSFEDLFRDTDVLIKEYLKKGASIILELKEEEKTVEAVFDDITKKAGEIDVTLQPMIKAELKKSLKSLKNIENKLIKAEKQKEEISINQIKNLKEKLFPNNKLQERNDNIISLFLPYGINIIEILIKELKPLDKRFTILTPEQ